jgi:FKBP-type peptidyl-prolyl cis-trans isomerase
VLAGAGKGKKRQAESTDFMATFLTRRFGIAGGLAWLGVLTFGVVSEQVKTRIEVAEEEKNARDVTSAKEVRTRSGLVYQDLRIGGGQSPAKGLLVVLNFKLSTLEGEEIDNTYTRGKPIVFYAGRRPFTGGLCAGVEEGIATMRAGGKRRLVVPPELGFGAEGGFISPTLHVEDKKGVVPPNATLVYEIELVRVSIPPS